MYNGIGENQPIDQWRGPNKLALRIMSNTSKTEPSFSSCCRSNAPCWQFIIGVLKSFTPRRILNSPAALRPKVPEVLRSCAMLPYSALENHRELNPYHHRITLWYIFFHKPFPRPKPVRNSDVPTTSAPRPRNSLCLSRLHLQPSA